MNTSQEIIYKTKVWSDSPIHEAFSIKFFTDTNLLVYLVDHTYPNLNNFIAILNSVGFTRVISSQYVMFEFVGVRKREHYLRVVADNSQKTPDGKINFGSLIKYQNKYDAPNVVFEDSILLVKKEVDNELESIIRDYNIDYTYSSLHQDQLSPTFDICLSFKNG
ncbi:MAG: hypothetical protein M0D57_04660 [Sphingobacteriales bacterium JAD_PAG50586_3]|nr:MAG: hypothetical protein M0D57_04660 [Sphingobacteriales bacterium JAD_PAG50586_3]